LSLLRTALVRVNRNIGFAVTLERGTDMNRDNLEQLLERLLREERVQQMVRARAYEIYQVRGGQPGFEAHDWFRAESEVLAFLIAQESRLEDAQPAAGTTPSAAASETPKPRESGSRAASKAANAKHSATKKTAPKRVTSKKPETKPKTKRTRKATAKDEPDK
jgi:Protein of unknown function (DUF2934)